MKRTSLNLSVFTAAILLFLVEPAAAQPIKVNPTALNINAQGGTVAFLTFGGLTDEVPADACWCRELTPAAPDIGLMCDPATILGCLPTRYDQSVHSGTGGFTDIMSIPPSVARRAYQAAAEGETSSFHYVRRFVSPSGGPDQYVSVLLRLTGGGARTPFSLTSVTLGFDPPQTVTVVRPDELVPPIEAEIVYSGTGRLMGRWEVVLPGDQLPEDDDLLTGATLPAEARTLQRRYTQISTFNVFLPPTGRYTLPGPDPSRLPTRIPGQYFMLLRIECTDDKEDDSDLAAVGAGPGVIHAGAVAAFPLPTLRYFVGGTPDVQQSGGVSFAPADRAVILTLPVVFTWPVLSTEAALYRLEIERLSGEHILSALVPPELSVYRAPPLLVEKAGRDVVRWRVLGLDTGGKSIIESAWRTLRIGVARS
ncbi:MAG: hypothetical protein AB1714_11815 [Acidobacteriota bacterium]